MKKLSLLAIPLGIMCSGVTLAPAPQPKPSVDLRHISGHVSSLKLEAPANLTFAGMPVPLDRPHVKQRLDRELKKHQYYQTSNLLIHKRAARYREVFQEILRTYHVPEDFFYLSIAESALSNATSPVGAKGFWQFMPATARAYGLEVSQYVDERYNPEKAAHAAALYFLDAFDRFGDWNLVAAAYNMGPGGVARQVRQQQECDYFELDLNAETSAYMYRILTYKVIMEHPALFNLTLNDADMYAPIAYRSVWVNKSIHSLSRFAKEQGVDLESLKALNPWMVGEALYGPSGKTYEVRIPLEDEFFAAELAVTSYSVDIADTDEKTDSTQTATEPLAAEEEEIPVLEANYLEETPQVDETPEGGMGA